MPQGRKPYGAPLTEAQILAWAQAHYARVGRWPHHGSGRVIGVPGQSWGGVNEALRRGLRGLPGGDSLAQLLNRHRALSEQTNRRWTANEDQLVLTLPAREVARRTGRSMRSVYVRRHRLGVGRR
jgi:hypothetical protein